MITKSTFITRRVWDSLDLDLRKAILARLPFSRAEIVNHLFVSNVENELRMRGEYEIANVLVAKEEQ